MSVALTKQERFWCCIDMKHLAKICIFITPFVAEAAFAQDLAPATPESQGVSSRAILRWIEECETTAATNGFRGGFLHGFVIVRHGKTIAEGTWAPQNTLERPHMLYSHSKSFTSTAIGFLVDEGKIDLDSRVLSFFPDVAPENPSENLRQVRGAGFEMMTFSTFLARCRGGGGATRCMPEVSLMSGFEKPPPSVPNGGKVYEGAVAVDVAAPLARLPHFERIGLQGK